MNRKLFSAFFLTLFFFLFFEPIFPYARILAFAPLLVMMIVQRALLLSLYGALFIGIFMDLLSSHQMGIYALTYTVATAFLTRYRKHFFEDTPLNLGFFTAFFSLAFNLIFLVFFFIFEKREALSIKWLFTDLFALPILDGIYAALWIGYPLVILEKWEKKVKCILLNRKRGR